MHGEVDTNDTDVITGVIVESAEMNLDGDCVLNYRCDDGPAAYVMPGAVVTWRLLLLLRTWKKNRTPLHMMRDEDTSTSGITLWNPVGGLDRAGEAFDALETTWEGVSGLVKTVGKVAFTDSRRKLLNRFLQHTT